MSYGRGYEFDDQGSGYDGFAADAAVDERRAFIQKTYMHVFGAILAFVGLEALFLKMVEGREVAFMRAMGGAWIVAMILFLVVSWLAGKWAQSDTSVPMQYVGLGLYVLFEAVIFMPIMIIAKLKGPDIIPAAAFLTLMIFGGLTAFVLLTKKDFSFMGGFLCMLSLAALGLIVVSFIVPGMSLGIWFSGLMIMLMSGYILYDTSNILHHYRTTQHVAAALALFASVATLFYYVLRLAIALSGRD